MLDLTIQELAALTGGELKLSDMPPLGGDCEPLRRFVFESRKVRPGDVFWALPEGDAPQTADAAFLRSALGVVSERRNVTPWAGAFSLYVRDSRAALEKVARHARSQFQGSLVVVLGDDAPRNLTAALFAVLDGRTRGCSARVQTSVEAARALLELPVGGRTAVLKCSLQEISSVDAILELSQPDVAVISSAALMRPTAHSSGTPDRLAATGDESLQTVVFAAAEQLGRDAAETTARWEAWRHDELAGLNAEEDCRGGRGCVSRRRAA